MFADMPETACCKGCGYLLRGLPAEVCPECGRPFDPLNARTYHRSPGRKRAKRWALRLTFLLIAAGVCFAMFPRSRVTARLVMTCQECKRSYTATRTEYRPARWVPFRYPGWFSEFTNPAPGATCSGMQPTRIVIRIVDETLTLKGFKSGLPVTVFVDQAPSEVTAFASIPATRRTAREFLRVVLRKSTKSGGWDFTPLHHVPLSRDGG